MARVVDITERLDFDGNPRIRIREEEIEVNADAATMLKVVGVLGRKEDPGAKEVMDMYGLMFSEAEREKINGLKLSFKDFTTLVYAAISLVGGEDGGRGEQ